MKGWGSRFLLIVTGVFVGVLVGAGAARADCANEVYDQALPVTSATPAASGSISATTSPAPFSVVSTTEHGNIWIRVDSQDVIGDTGVLSDLYQEDFFGLLESSTNLGVYTGNSNATTLWWTNTPGTYYWQALMTYLNTSTWPETCNLEASPVYQLTVAAPPPVSTPTPTAPTPTTPVLASLSPTVARSVALRTINAKTGATRGVRVTCADSGAHLASCALAWRIGRARFRASGRIWDFLRGASPHFGYDLRGTRTWLGCWRGQPRRACHRRFHWTAGPPLTTTSSPPSPTPTPAPTPPTSTPMACYPLSSSGGCYEPGEYCSNNDHGMAGVAGDGKTIICEDNDGWRWEPE